MEGPTPYDGPMGGIDAVIFDLGGVVMDSPLHAIARYELELASFFELFDDVKTFGDFVHAVRNGP